MEYMTGVIVGLLMAAVLFFCMYVAYKAGQRSRKPVHREVDEETKRKAEQLRKSFHDLMSYDTSKAVGRKG